MGGGNSRQQKVHHGHTDRQTVTSRAQSGVAGGGVVCMCVWGVLINGFDQELFSSLPQL